MDKIDKIYQKAIIIIVTIGVVYFLITSIHKNNRKGVLETLDYQFDGAIDSISYNVKGDALIAVNRKQYYLGAPQWNFYNNRILQKGDSVIKQRYSLKILLIKKNGQKIILGNDK